MLVNSTEFIDASVMPVLPSDQVSCQAFEFVSHARQGERRVKMDLTDDLESQDFLVG